MPELVTLDDFLKTLGDVMRANTHWTLMADTERGHELAIKFVISLINDGLIEGADVLHGFTDFHNTALKFYGQVSVFAFPKGPLLNGKVREWFKSIDFAAIEVARDQHICLLAWSNLGADFLKSFAGTVLNGNVAGSG